MKLRIRSVNGSETLRIDIPADSSLQSLKEAIAQTLNLLNSEIYLSLNKKVELEIPPQEQLQSFGIRGGDLVFYTLDPNCFKTNVAENPDRQTSTSNPSNPTLTQNACNSVRTGSLSTNASHQNQKRSATNRSPCQSPTHQTPSQNPGNQTLRELCASAAMKRAFKGSNSNSNSNSGQSNEVAGEKMEEEKIGDEPQAMYMDDEFVEVSRSVPDFFERVLVAELENLKDVQGLLILAVHAVMLEAGFLGFDVRNSKGLLGFRLPQGWAGKPVVSICYTLDELVINNRDSKDVKNVELKFNDIGSYLVAYGRVPGSMGSQNYRLCLESGKFLPSLEHVIGESYANKEFHYASETLGGNHKKDHENPTATNSSNMESQIVCETRNGVNLPLMGKPQDSSTHEAVLFELWRIVKDRLCMPVLTALCENAGLPLPPSLIMLPTELKMNILEALPAADVMKMGCVCTEFRYLSANDELWKQKYMDEKGPLLPDGSGPSGAIRWKDAFKNLVERKRTRQLRRRFVLEPVRLPSHRPLRRYRFPFGTPGYGISGGDFDRFPGIGGDGRSWGGRGIGGGCLLGAVDVGRRPGFPFTRRSVISDCDMDEYRFGVRTAPDPEDPLFPDM